MCYLLSRCTLEPFRPCYVFCLSQNSSLVLTADTRTKDYAHEPSGEPETLWGRIKVSFSHQIGTRDLCLFPQRAYSYLSAACTTVYGIGVIVWACTHPSCIVPTRKMSSRPAQDAAICSPTACAASQCRHCIIQHMAQQHGIGHWCLILPGLAAWQSAVSAALEQQLVHPQGVQAH